MSAEDYWWNTPAEHGRYLEGVSLARRDALDALTVAAWQGVAFDRTKRLPDLQRLLSRRADDQQDSSSGETKEQLRAKWRHFFDRARAARGGR